MQFNGNGQINDIFSFLFSKTGVVNAKQVELFVFSMKNHYTDFISKLKHGEREEKSGEDIESENRELNLSHWLQMLGAALLVYLDGEWCYNMLRNYLQLDGQSM